MLPFTYHSRITKDDNGKILAQISHLLTYKSHYIICIEK